MKLLPMKPQPPVTSIELMLESLSLPETGASVRPGCAVCPDDNTGAAARKSRKARPSAGLGFLYGVLHRRTASDKVNGDACGRLDRVPRPHPRPGAVADRRRVRLDRRHNLV